MSKKTMRIGIMPLKIQRERTLAIARGEYKPTKKEPKVWFPSMASLGQVLSDENQALLNTIATQHPETVTTLAKLTGRQPGNLSRTLKTMEQYGLVRMSKIARNVKPEALATSFDIKTGDWGFMNHIKKQTGNHAH